jgi:MFS transporter, DHA1 family, inner membrane transport protein
MWSMTETHSSDATRTPLWMLLLGNFIIGVGIMIPAGLQNPIAADFKVSAATAGQLMLVGGVVVAFGAPLFAALTSAVERRVLLTFALALYAVGHVASAFVTDINVLFALRALTVVGAAIYTPQAAATASLLVPPEQRAASIAFIFIGWSASAVGGVPLASYLASIMSWQAVYLGMGGFCAIAALLIWLNIKPGLFVSPLNGAAWKQALTTPVILAILLVTTLSMSGQMTVFTYVAPIIRDAFGGGPAAISWGFAVAGVTGVVGNTLASRVVGRFGIDNTILVALIMLVIGLGLFAASFGTLLVGIIGLGIWGLGSFSSNSLQQSRLVAVAPQLASATVSLNTSVVYVGQAVGAALGGWYMAQATPPSAAIGWSGAALTLLAVFASLFATRLAKKSG